MTKIASTTDLINLASALDVAVRQGRFMSTDYAKVVWKDYLEETGYSTPRVEKKSNKKVVETTK